MNQKLLNLLNQYLITEPEAIAFLRAFSDYINAIDDLIDKGIPNTEALLKTYGQALYLYSSNFYLKYGSTLFPLLLSIHNAYADSVLFERAEEDWKKKTADVLRLSGFEVILVVVGLIAGYDKMREVSILLREYAYEMHHDKETGKPI